MSNLLESILCAIAALLLAALASCYILASSATAPGALIYGGASLVLALLARSAWADHRRELRINNPANNPSSTCRHEYLPK